MSRLTGTVVFVEFVTPAAEIARSHRQDEPGYGRNSQLAQLQALATEHEGEVVTTRADGIAARFPVPSGAMRFAVAAQRQVSSSLAAGGAAPALRVGISIGEIVRAAEAWHGRAMTEAARLCQLAKPGHILSSRAVRLVAGSVTGVRIEERGSHHFDGLPDPVDVDEIIWPTVGDRPLRVLLADDAVLIRQGVARLLEDAGIAVIGQTGDAASIAELADRLAPDVLITDVRMPPTFTLEGLRVALELRARSPRMAVLVLSQHLETRYAVELLGGDAGGVGYLLKERVSAVDDFIAAVRRVASGGTAIDPEMVSLLIGRTRRDRGLTNLSPREEEILSLMAQGLSNSGIARRLTLGIRTVESHVSSIFAKLGLFPQVDDERRVLAVIQNLRA